jgi:hypothetical protein
LARAAPAAGAQVGSATAEASAEGHRRVAIAVGRRGRSALVLVRQQVVGLGHVREALGGLGVVGVAVGVQRLGRLAVGGLDVLLVRAAQNTGVA